MKHLNCIGKYTSPWLGYVKGTLENWGLNSVWMSHVQSGSGVSSECVERILQDQFLQKWFSRISEDETFSTYKIYKDIHEFENYIDILPDYLKYSLFDFRTGSQKLSVNRRSNVSIPRQERTKCIKIILGDEFHFLFEFNGIEKLRISIIPKKYRTRCSTLKMSQLLNTNDRKLLIKVAKFVYFGMKEYTSFPDVVSEEIDNVDLNCLYD